MSPRSLVDRDDWMAAGRELINQGHIPADVALVTTGERVGASTGTGKRVSTGSFYSHFRGVADFYTALIEDWARSSLAEVLPPGEARAVRDPRDKLRLLRSRWAAGAGPGGTMRRWAGRAALLQRPTGEDEAAKAAAAKAAEAAVAALDREVVGHVRRALEDVGLAGEHAAVEADVMVKSWVADYHVNPPAEMDAEAAAAAEAEAERQFDVHLDFIAASSEARRPGEVAAAPGDAPAEVLLYMIARALDPAAQRELLAEAQQFVRGRDREDPDGDPPGYGLPAADAS